MIDADCLRQRKLMTMSWRFILLGVSMLTLCILKNKYDHHRLPDFEAELAKAHGNAWIDNKGHVDWEEVLHFIPDKTEEDCLKLFTTNSSAHIEKESVAFKKFTYNMMLITAEDIRLRHIKHFTAPRHTKLTLTYQALAKPDWVKTVCEIGFDLGQSTIAWLTVKPDLIIHSFDIGLTFKTPYLAKLIKEKFGPRFHFHLGDSRITVPMWAEKLKGQCDIVSVDGGHEYEHVVPDLINMKKMAARRHILVSRSWIFSIIVI